MTASGSMLLTVAVEWCGSRKFCTGPTLSGRVSYVEYRRCVARCTGPAVSRARVAKALRLSSSDISESQPAAPNHSVGDNDIDGNHPIETDTRDSVGPRSK